MLDVAAVWALSPARLDAGRVAEPSPADPGPARPARTGDAGARRAGELRAALAAAGARMVPARPHGDAPLTAVHDPAMLAHLARTGGAPGPAGAAPVAGTTGTAGAGETDPYRLDRSPPLDRDTWRRARSSADAALTAADLVAAGEPVAYAICHFPGLHASRAGYGGRCYLNNAAVAATALRTAGIARVAIIDIDAHHGDGTQSLFYDRADVFYGSVHVDEDRDGRQGGSAVERGMAAGTGATRNVPLPRGVGDPGWLAALAWLRAEAAEFGARAVVLSLGVDGWADDPASPFALTADGYRIAGSLLRDMRVPVVAVSEDGYHLPSLGPLTVAVLRGLTGGAGRPGGGTQSGSSRPNSS